MKNYPVGIRSLALSFPSNICTNDYYRQKYPDLVAQSEQKSLARLFSLDESTPSNEFDQEMMPYLSDPFRGAVERRILAPGESSLTLECRAAQDALDAANFSVEDIDLAIVTSFGTEEIVAGNAAFLVNQLGLRCAAWNLNSMCSSAMVALQTASTLVQAGEYRNILVVTSCAYSRLLDERDTISWITGDGAGAIVISKLKANQGILGSKTVHSAETCSTFHTEIAEDSQGNLRLFMKTGKGANRVISNTSADFVLRCCQGAAAAANVTIAQIDFFIFNTPTAWFAKFSARILGINPERTINLYPQYGNIGPVLPLANMYHAARSGKIHENDLVLVYSFGASANATATVMRWGDVALSPTTSCQEFGIEMTFA
ncbi:3-oxoacyl-(acyl-carrier-protein) synthase III (plasmid) [Cylindrospermum stagnale PCC 7417]|uniref:3-oxoacyl-(Acyl-carrier-protein) synthase III n=1 Tax=Cylindrospermum stagnale PCC 7417 TaxID=56107 RepID=K9X7B6_9NOST|nr:3-oxoacyl-[acyl-carrier-protein] synthase III C-terminal domain-containing protein [Cylindrospermum stagnale]AFZ28388.1 3-oxoacyl-(acyl-carrier-protein) synthase III [Cylindrospermum stagnale PCC 7417]